MSDSMIGPNRPFDPKKETKEEYEIKAIFPILVLGNGKEKGFQKKKTS